jgi:hypothetical protein
MSKVAHVLLIGAGVLLSFVAGYQWHAIPLSQVHAEGILQHEAPVHPAVTPTYPPGYYLIGRIYVDGSSPEMVGKRVILSGSLTVQGDPETPTYPKIAARDLWAGLPMVPSQGAAETPAREPVSSRP